MWVLGYKESWASKKRCFWTVVLEKTLESPLDFKESHPVHSKGNESWIFTGRTNAETETLILWPPDAKNWLGCWERLKAGEEGNDIGQDGWMASPTQWIWFEQPVGVGNGQGGLACYSLWCRKESDSTEQLNWTDPHGISKPLSGMDLIFFSDWSTPLFHVHW